jgi:hypothetical protein
VALLVLVVRRRGQVEVAHHVARRVLRLPVAAGRGQVPGQPFQQVDHALHTLVATGQHLEGVVEAGGRRRVQGQG